MKMSSGFFYKLIVGLVVTSLVGMQCLYAQNITRYETKGKGAWEQASNWEIVTSDSQGNVVSRQDATTPPQPSDDVMVNHPIEVNNETKVLRSLTVTGSGLITGESAETDISIDVENDIIIENGGQISTTIASKEWFVSTGTISLSSNNGNVTVNGIVETGKGLNSTDILNRGGLSGDIYILADPNGLIVIGSGARLVTGRGGNGAEADVDGVDATNGGTSGDISLEGNRIKQLGSVITGAGGTGGDAGANGGDGGGGGDSGQIAIVGNDIKLSGFVRTGDGGNGGNSKANDQDAGDGGDSGEIAVSNPAVLDATIVIDNCDITQGQAGAGGSAKGTNASAGSSGNQGGVLDANDLSEPCPKISGEIIYISLENPKVDLDGALCSIESKSDVIFYGLHEEAISGEFGVTVSAPGVIDLTNVVAGKNMIISPFGEIVFHVSDADNILLAPDMTLAEITEPDAIVIEDLQATYIVIDDFESYSPYWPDELLWDIWLDGWGDPDNGSSAGYSVPDDILDYMEVTIVHSGNFSLPLFYDNSVGLSEITRTLNANWDQSGVDTLTLWYHGVKDNDAEPMYVALNDDAIVTNDDPDAALVDEWVQWDIPLQAFTDQGVDLENVGTISIGFGNKANPAPGGEGHVFFDDIRLYLPGLD
jgi:hypothetical protein